MQTFIVSNRVDLTLEYGNAEGITSEEGKEDGVQHGKCGICKKIATKSEKGVMCKMCEGWYDERRKRTCLRIRTSCWGLDKINYFCSSCDKITGKVLRSITELLLRHNKLVERESGQCGRRA